MNTPSDHISKSEFTDMMQSIVSSNGTQNLNIAVGVSGGADSMALCMLLDDWCADHNASLVALTYDHGLRAESKDEAIFVQNTLKSLGIDHHILSATPRKSHCDAQKTRIQETARHNRYQALSEYCRDHEISTLAIAHHLDDQAETVLMRLARGSGLRGLRGMATSRALDNQSLTLMRPLLSVPKSRLIATCEKHNIKWIEDPSNTDDTYTRVQFRQAKEILDNLGLTTVQIENTRQKLVMAQSFIDQALATTLENCAYQVGKAFEMSYTDFMALDRYLQVSLIERILTDIGDTDYPPRWYKLNDLVDQLGGGDFKSSTLNHCLIALNSQGFVCIQPEKNGL